MNCIILVLSILSILKYIQGLIVTCSYGVSTSQVMNGILINKPYTEMLLVINDNENTGMDRCATITGTYSGKPIVFYTGLSTDLCNSVLPKTFTFSFGTMTATSISCCNTDTCNTAPSFSKCYYGLTATNSIPGLTPITPSLMEYQDVPIGDGIGALYCAVITGTYNSQTVSYANWVNYISCSTGNSPATVPFNGVTITVTSILCCTADGCNTPEGFLTTTISTTTTPTSAVLGGGGAISQVTGVSVTSTTISNTSSKNSQDRVIARIEFNFSIYFLIFFLYFYFN